MVTKAAVFSKSALLEQSG